MLLMLLFDCVKILNRSGSVNLDSEAYHSIKNAVSQKIGKTPSGVPAGGPRGKE